MNTHTIEYNNTRLQHERSTLVTEYHRSYRIDAARIRRQHVQKRIGTIDGLLIALAR